MKTKLFFISVVVSLLCGCSYPTEMRAVDKVVAQYPDCKIYSFANDNKFIVITSNGNVFIAFVRYDKYDRADVFNIETLTKRK